MKLQYSLIWKWLLLWYWQRLLSPMPFLGLWLLLVNSLIKVAGCITLKKFILKHENYFVAPYVYFFRETKNSTILTDLLQASDKGKVDCSWNTKVLIWGWELISESWGLVSTICCRIESGVCWYADIWILAPPLLPAPQSASGRIKVAYG